MENGREQQIEVSVWQIKTQGGPIDIEAFANKGPVTMGHMVLKAVDFKAARALLAQIDESLVRAYGGVIRPAV